MSLKMLKKLNLFVRRLAVLTITTHSVTSLGHSYGTSILSHCTVLPVMILKAIHEPMGGMGGLKVIPPRNLEKGTPSPLKNLLAKPSKIFKKIFEKTLEKIAKLGKKICFFQFFSKFFVKI